MDIDWVSVKEVIVRWLLWLLSVLRNLAIAGLFAFLVQVAALMMSDGYGMDEEPLIRMTFLGMAASIFFGIEIGRRLYGPKPPKQ